MAEGCGAAFARLGMDASKSIAILGSYPNMALIIKDVHLEHPEGPQQDREAFDVLTISM